MKVERHRRRVRVFVELDGKDVSRVYLAPHELSVGPRGEVSMLGIAGVGTEPEFRSRGLARRVFSRSMEEARRGKYSCLGLFTGSDIVAHRLYRQYGFVDMRRETPFKLLDPKKFAQSALTHLLARHAETGSSGSRTWTLRLALAPHSPFDLRMSETEARVADRAARSPDLTLTAASSTFALLCLGDIAGELAEAANLLTWRGDRAAWRRLLVVLASQRQVVRGWKH